jgi:hypothetical protein
MSKGKHLFKETDVSRLVRIAQKNNLSDFRIRIDRDGSVELSVQKAEEPRENGCPNSFDHVLGTN